jgi:hypothetical protein
MVGAVIFNLPPEALIGLNSLLELAAAQESTSKQLDRVGSVLGNISARSLETATV